MEPSESEPVSEAEKRLRELEERLNRASAAAERLMAEAADAAVRPGEDPGRGDAVGQGGGADGGAGDGVGGGAGDAGGAGTSRDPHAGKPPPAGWQAPEDSASRGRGDLDLLMQVVGSVRDLVPPDLQRRLAEALRELLLALRALIDWYLERSEDRRRETTEVQDIPID